MAEPIDIKDVPMDTDPNKVVRVYNPLEQKFFHKFGGKEFVLPPGVSVYPEPIARHMAKHLADRICRKQNNDFLQAAFPGLDDSGREKWKISESHVVTKEEVKRIQELLLSGLDEEVKEIKGVPESDSKRKHRQLEELRKQKVKDDVAKAEEDEKLKKEAEAELAEKKAKEEEEKKAKEEQDEVDTVKELKEALDELGVEIPSGALKADLEKLYEENKPEEPAEGEGGEGGDGEN